MAASQRPMTKVALRESLAESRVAAVTIAVLMILSLANFFDALWTPGYRFFYFVATAIAIMGMPSNYLGATSSDRVLLIASCAYLYSSLVNLTVAWLLSRWVYGMGPFRALRNSAAELVGRQRV